MKRKFPIFKLVKELDHFSLPIALMHKGKGQYKTALGGFLSIIVYLTILLNAWLLGMDVYKKENPLVIMSEDNLAPINMTFISDNFFVAFYFSDENNNIFDDPTVMSIRAVSYSNIINSNGTQSYQEQEIEMVPCDQVYTRESSLVEYSFLSKLKCLKERSILFGGSWSEQYIYAVNLKVFYCKNDTIKSNCKSMEEIEKIIRTQYINIYQQTLQVNSKNYNSPIKKFAGLSYFRLETSFHKELDFYFGKTNILTDSGIIFADFIQTHSEIGFVHLDTDVNLSTDNQIILIEMYFSQNIKYYSRSYIKIQTVFANLGGIINILFLSGRLLIIRITTRKFKLKIINTFFSVRSGLGKNYTNGTDTNIKKESQLGILPSNNTLCLRDNSDQDLDAYIKSFKNQKLRFSKKEMFCSLFYSKKCKTNYKEQIYQHASKFSNNFTDLISIVKHLGEIIKLKYLFLNEEQLIALDFFSKMSFGAQHISHKQESFQKLFIEQVNQKERVIKLRNYLSKNKKMLSDVDLKIIDILEEDLQKIVADSPSRQK
jgi:hypothetical protein